MKFYCPIPGKQRKIIAFTLMSVSILLFSGLYVVMRVQNRFLENNATQNAMRHMVNAYSGKSPDSEGLAGFYIINYKTTYNGKLPSFSFISGFDKANPQRQFSGPLSKYAEKSNNKRIIALTRKIHDIGSQVITTGKYFKKFETSPGKPPVILLGEKTSRNQVTVVFMPLTSRGPSIPWLSLVLALTLAILLAAFLKDPFGPLWGTLLFGIVWGLGVSAYRLNPDFGAFQYLSLGLKGFSRGYFPVAWIIVFSVSFLLSLSWFTGHGKRFFRAIKDFKMAYTYIFPAMAGMMVLVLIPFAAGLALGFFNHCRGQFQFVGISNFIEILSGGGSSITNPLNFWFTLGVTILWTSVNVFLHVGIGLGIALLLKDPLLKMKGIYRVLLIIPWAMPNYITALMWKGMFQQQYGALNILLDNIGIGSISWFSSFWPAFMANVITNTWLGFPFMMVVSLGALQSIPASLYEAAQVDGASKWQQFRMITLPLLRPALFPAIVLGSIWTFNMFNIIYLVSGGEPGGATDILITEAYQWAFKRGERYGLAAAYASLIFVILYLYTKAANKITRAAEDI